jgi:hypothetical protein
VVATAAGPGITGWLIDRGISFPQQTLYLSAWCVVMCAVFVVVAPRITRELPAAPQPSAA